MRDRNILAAIVASMLLLFSRPALAQTSGDLDKFAGAYKATSIMVFHIRTDGGTLFFRPGGQNEMALLAEGPNRFIEVMSNAQFVFSGDSPDMELTASNGIHVLHARRISEEAAKALEDAVAARVKANLPSPSTEASLRRYIDSLEKGAPNYEEMEPRVAEEGRNQQAGLLAEIHKLGALQSMTFTGVSDAGMDVYDATFEHGHVNLSLAPLDPDGKVEFRGFSPRN